MVEFGLGIGFTLLIVWFIFSPINISVEIVRETVDDDMSL